ncbi:MAG: hypothetical protein P4L64_12730 [Caulobacteraceae bacterium]|nr:hypothetical protein [Caulobacteraceae bacterium]
MRIPSRLRGQGLQQTQRRVALAAGLFGGGVALELGLMLRQAMWLQGLGAICGQHSAALLVHCPGCYVAAALMLSGIAVAMAPAPKALARVRRV